VSVLLRQPHGLEGVRDLGASAKDFNPGRLPVAEPHRDEKRVADTGIAPRHRPRYTALDDHLVAAIVNSIDLPATVGEGVPLRSNHGRILVSTSFRARLDRSGSIDVLDLRISKGEHALDVLAVPGVDGEPEDLDVLLRHRPRSIPQDQASA